MEEEFWNLVPQDCIRKMKTEKINANMISLMSEEELSKYIPLHRDRRRLKNYLTRSQLEKKHDKKIKRKEILDALRKRIEDRREKRKAKTVSSSSEKALEDKKPKHLNGRNVQQNEFQGFHTEVQMRRKGGGGIRNKTPLMEGGDLLSSPLGGENDYNMNRELTEEDIVENPDETKNVHNDEYNMNREITEDALENREETENTYNYTDDHNMNREFSVDAVEYRDETKNAHNDGLLANNKGHRDDREELIFEPEADHGDLLQRAITLAGIVLDETDD